MVDDSTITTTTTGEEADTQFYDNNMMMNETTGDDNKCAPLKHDDKFTVKWILGSKSDIHAHNILKNLTRKQMDDHFTPNSKTQKQLNLEIECLNALGRRFEVILDTRAKSNIVLGIVIFHEDGTSLDKEDLVSLYRTDERFSKSLVGSENNNNDNNDNSSEDENENKEEDGSNYGFVQDLLEEAMSLYCNTKDHTIYSDWSLKNTVYNKVTGKFHMIDFDRIKVPPECKRIRTEDQLLEYVLEAAEILRKKVIKCISKF